MKKKKSSPPEEDDKSGIAILEEDIIDQKRKGDKAFESGDIEDAIALYTEGIRLLDDLSTPPSKNGVSSSRLTSNSLKQQKTVLNRSSSSSLQASCSSSSLSESFFQSCGASLYGNRAAAHYMLFEFEKSLEDAMKGYQLDSKRFKLLHRASWAALSMGDIEKACHLLELTPSHQRSEERGGMLYEDYQRCTKGLKIWKEKVLKHPDTPSSDAGYKQLQELFPESAVFTMLAAKSAAKREQYTRAAQCMMEVEETKRFPAFYVLLAECLFFTGCDALPAAISAIEIAIRELPTSSCDKRKEYMKFHERLQSVFNKKIEGDNAYKKKVFLEAIECYTKSIEEARTSKGVLRTLYCNRAAAYKELFQFEKSIEDCTNALEQDYSFAKGYARRGRCYMAIEDYAAAMQDFKKAMHHDSKTDQYNQEYALAAAKLSSSMHAARRANTVRNGEGSSINDASDQTRREREGKRDGAAVPPGASGSQSAREWKGGKKDLDNGARDPKDFYVVLGVSTTATDIEIRKKYRELSLQLHPDKCMNLPLDERLIAEQKFKLINEAYGTLGDREKRFAYDRRKRGGLRRRHFAAGSTNDVFGFDDSDDNFGPGFSGFRDPNAPQYRTRAGTKGWW